MRKREFKGRQNSPGPVGKPHSPYAMRQARRFSDQGYKLPEIAARMGLTQHDVRQLLRAEARIVTSTPVVDPFRPLPTAAPEGRSYSLAPSRQPGSALGYYGPERQSA